MPSPPPVLLASSSAYRRALLTRILPAFECAAPGADESPLQDEAPDALATRLAMLKAMQCAEQRPDAVIIGSDQVPAIGTQLLGKPGSHERAAAQLRQCSAQSVVFFTAVTVLGPAALPAESYVDRTTVHFRALSDAQIERYLAKEQPYDCAGSFKAEALGIVLFERIESIDPTGIQGLPLIWLSACLNRRGVPIP
ncbi:MAG: Maf family nucleotide pyrophosphatase [Gammaproteobacteria bacterium]|nr:Maf family nucleotide pyrophosphatase [Gammaproteobacteria bacterium]